MTENKMSASLERDTQENLCICDYLPIEGEKEKGNWHLKDCPMYQGILESEKESRKERVSSTLVTNSLMPRKMVDRDEGLRDSPTRLDTVPSENSKVFLVKVEKESEFWYSCKFNPYIKDKLAIELTPDAEEKIIDKVFEKWKALEGTDIPLTKQGYNNTIKHAIREVFKELKESLR